VTTLESAKGLQAGHVFVVGVNDGHFPRSNARPTDHEVCCMLVAMTRATKCCHVISCGRPFGSATWTAPGVFIRWLDGLTERVEVNAEYFRG
jgi:superfamily I DNA/RNA helicase